MAESPGRQLPLPDVPDPPRSRVPGRPRARATRWRRQYVTILVVEDALAAVAAVALGWTLGIGLPSDKHPGVYLAFGTVVALLWLASLQIVGGYELRQVTAGAQEIQRVLRAALNLAGALAIFAYLSHVVVARAFIAFVIPVGAVLQLLVRYAVRFSVYLRRSRGEWVSTILAVGTAEATRHLVDATRRNVLAGLVVVGACVEDAPIGSEIVPGVPVLGDVLEVAAIAEKIDADVVAVAGDRLGPRRIRELGWELEGTGRDMVMAPGLTEVAGPRVHVSPVEGLPLMWVEQPQFSGAARVAKRAMDVTGALLLVLVTAPVLLLVSLVVGLGTRGPVLYRSTRLGVQGRPFTVYKFRSMYVGSDDRRAELQVDNEVEGGVLFKVRRDPRVTLAGRFLRKFSLDELPQLFNVLGGSMSLVGPRPPLPGEVEQYHGDVHRRLLVKPGMTGLWQVSGRSDLSWDEAVRLDLYYVENWSLALDIAIVLRTIWAVLRSRGAY